MERKIGEIFEYNGEWYQCVESSGCENCAFKERKCYLEGGTDDPIGECCYDRRRDSKDVIFKKLEKVGEPIEFARGLYFQRYLLAYSTAFYEGDTRLFFNAPTNTFVYIEIKQNKEDMEEKNNGNTLLNVLTDKYVNGDICYDDFEKEVKALYSCKEEIKPTLKPFDLEVAKSGKPVCTRDGRKARIICFDSIGGRPIVALVTECDEEEIPYKYHCDGSYNCQSIPSDNDLMMLSEKKEGWVNLWRHESGTVHPDGNVYSSKEKVVKIGSRDYNYVATVKVEWEE